MGTTLGMTGELEGGGWSKWLWSAKLEEKEEHESDQISTLKEKLKTARISFGMKREPDCHGSS